MDPAEVRVPQRRHSRLRRAFFRAVEHTCATLGGRRLYRRRQLSASRLRQREERIAIPGLPRALEGFRIAHLSDLHAGPFLGRGDLAEVVDVVNAGGADLCALTGDLITRHWSEALEVLDDLARLRARHGVFGVFGNHDYRDRREGEIAAAYAEHGLRFLRNENHRIVLGGAALVVSGLEDLEEARRIDVAAARAGVRPGDVEVLLCHNPGRAAGLARPGCVAILAGHTHGGQVDLPLLRRLGPPHPGGRLEFGSTSLVVSNGLGVIGLPLRVGAPAEVVWVVLESAPGGAASSESAARGARDLDPDGPRAKLR